ncbi:hypothetical protein [Coriobacterium glomerans]|nr:hypothetical protein [Coriobacterium glomerans]
MLISFFLPLFSVSFLGITITMSPAEMTFGKQILGTTVSNFSNILFIVPGVCAILALLALRDRAANIVSIVLGIVSLAIVLICITYIPTTDYIKPDMAIGLYLNVIASAALIGLSVFKLYSASRQKR